MSLAIPRVSEQPAGPSHVISVKRLGASSDLPAAVEDNGHRLDIVRGGVTVARIERAEGAQRGIDRASLNEVAAGLRELSLRQTLGPNLDLRDLVDEGRE